MTPDPMAEPEGPGDERFVYVVTAAGVEALRKSAAAFGSERAAPAANLLQSDASMGCQQARSSDLLAAVSAVERPGSLSDAGEGVEVVLSACGTPVVRYRACCDSRPVSQRPSS